jgi:hypothetical protein
MPQSRILPRSSGLALLGNQVYKEHSLWQNRADRSPGSYSTEYRLRKDCHWTVSIRLTDWLIDPEVALTVSVYVPEGVPFGREELPLPPQKQSKAADKQGNVDSATSGWRKRSGAII